MSRDEDTPTRRCARCRLVLPVDEFPLRRKDGSRRYGHCRSCKAAYQRQWYERNRDRHIANVRVSKQQLRARHLALVKEAKSGPCTDCGQRYPFYVMDFDHVRGRKVGEIGRMRGAVTTEQLLAEIAKCDVVCANCHRIRTHRRRTS